MVRKVLKLKSSCGACDYAVPLPTQSHPAGVDPSEVGPLFFCRAPLPDSVIRWNKHPFVFASGGEKCPTWRART
jgi:hypothetical protein